MAGCFFRGSGALAAGLAYATMGQVLVLGRLAETEATFTLLLSGALLGLALGILPSAGAPVARRTPGSWVMVWRRWRRWPKGRRRRSISRRRFVCFSSGGAIGGRC